MSKKWSCCQGRSTLLECHQKIIKYFRFLAEATDTDVELHNRGDKASLCINLCH